MMARRWSLGERVRTVRAGAGIGALAIMTACAAPAGAANLLANPSFENGTVQPFSWNTWGDGNVIWQTGGARTGSKCMNLGGPDLALMYQRVPGTAGGAYAVRAWARYDSGAGDGEIKVEFHDGWENKIIEHRQLVHPPSDWTEYSVTGIAPAGTVYVTATLVGFGGSTLLFDDVSLSEQTQDPDLLIDVRAKAHTFLGFGAQIWDFSADTARVCSDLNIRYVRVSSTSAAVQASAAGMNILLLRWSAPAQWLDGNNALMPQYVDDYAALWANTVADLAAAGLTPACIELSNEPDGDWNTYISPANYNTLVKLTRAELDARGLFDVGIVGPGLTHLDWNNHNSTWIGALDAQAVASLAAWGSHTWDDGSLCTGGASCIHSRWPDFGDSADARDPTLPKFITEFATKENTFHGVTYPHPDLFRDYNATNSMPYAVRVYENALALLNCGAHVPFIWQATDQDWETKGWGLIDLAGNPKPVFHALQTWWPTVPVGASVIDLGDQSASLTYAGAFVKDDRLVIGLANDSAAECSRTLRVTGAAGVQIVAAPACLMDHHGDPATQDPDTAQVIQRSLTVEPGNRIDVTLPADSTLTLVCDLSFAAGDINRDGNVDLADYVSLAGCLAGPNVITPPASCSAEHFARADLDADADVDLADLAHFAEAFAP